MTSATLGHVENIIAVEEGGEEGIDPDHLIKPCETNFSGNEAAEQIHIGRKRKSIDRIGPSQSGSRKKANRFGKTGEKIVLPKKFLLGGNITDPLNLNALYYDQAGKVLNERTPQSSPLPLPEYKKQVAVLIPPNINDPLNLNEDPNQADLVSPRSANHTKKKKNKHKKKRSNLAVTEADKLEESHDTAEVAEEDDVQKSEAVVEEPDEDQVVVKPATASETCLSSSATSKPKIEKQVSDDKTPSSVLVKPSKPETSLVDSIIGDVKSSLSGHSNKPSVKAKPKGPTEKFIYGNYNRYYGYRNPGMETDNRLDLFRAEWFEGKDVLDIGCNIGHVTLSLARDCHPKRIVGMDIDGKLVSIAKKNIRHYMKSDKVDLKKFPTSLPLTYGPIAAPAHSVSAFPHNVMFVQGNYVLDKDEELDLVQEEYDSILALSVTKWIHLNFGDAGLKRVFKRMHKQLRPGGKLILEPQPWSSYKKKKKLTDAIFKTFQQLRLRPDQFTEFLLSKEVGFVACEHLATPSSGFQRPLHVFTKSESHLTPPDGVTPLMDIYCTPSDTPQICGNTPRTPYESSSQDGIPMFELGGAGINRNSPNTWNTPTYM